MTMFAGVRRALGSISVRENKGVITVSGIPADVISKDITKIWKTTRVNAWMFNRLGRSEFSFYSFFAIEVLFIVEELIINRDARTNVRALKFIAERLKADTWLNSIKEERSLNFDYSKLNRFNVPFKPKQIEFLQTFERNVGMFDLRGFMNASDPGTGKTLGSLGLAELVDADCVFIICPKRAVLEVWEPEIERRYKERQHVWASSMGGDPRSDADIPRDAKFYIFHYQQLDRAIQLAAKLNRKRIVVLLDESHNLNESTSNQSQYFVELCNVLDPMYTLWMSGTPIKAIGNEAVPFLTTIDRYFTLQVKERFLKIFGKSAARAVDILSNRIGLSSFRAKKTDVSTYAVTEKTMNVKFKGAERFSLDQIKDEIKKFVEERTVYYAKNKKYYTDLYYACLDRYAKTIRNDHELSEFKVYKHYVQELNKFFDPVASKDQVFFCNRFEDKFILPKLSNEDKKVFRHTRSIVKYVMLKIRGEALGRILTRRRIECFTAMIPHCGLPEIIDAARKKVIVFTSYVEVVERTNDYLKEQGYTPLLVYGNTNKDLNSILAKFKNDPDANPLIATYDSLATAVNLVEANEVVLMNQPFRAYERDQATARADRMGQDTDVVIWSMLLDTGLVPNISTRSNEIMEWSKEQVDAIMGYTGSVDQYTTEGLDESGEYDDFDIATGVVMHALESKPIVSVPVSVSDKPKANFFFDF